MRGAGGVKNGNELENVLHPAGNASFISLLSEKIVLSLLSPSRCNETCGGIF